ncbi:MAG: type II toxin-antitoxin system HicB family antitoxin [Burkholderiales bacterium]|nr:type II toxin-antitoxin system HicB family antitoxin [Burkholderiales bacterium]
MQALIRLDVRVRAQVKKEGQWFISCAPALDVRSQGRTKEEALSNLSEALRLFIESCFGRGVLEEVLKDCGFQPAHDEDTTTNEDFLSVPISLISKKKHAAACAY